MKATLASWFREPKRERRNDLLTERQNCWPDPRAVGDTSDLGGGGFRRSTKTEVQIVKKMFYKKFHRCRWQIHQWRSWYHCQVPGWSRVLWQGQCCHLRNGSKHTGSLSCGSNHLVTFFLNIMWHGFCWFLECTKLQGAASLTNWRKWRKMRSQIVIYGVTYWRHQGFLTPGRHHHHQFELLLITPLCHKSSLKLTLFAQENIFWQIHVWVYKRIVWALKIWKTGWGEGYSVRSLIHSTVRKRHKENPE